MKYLFIKVVGKLYLSITWTPHVCHHIVFDKDELKTPILFQFVQLYFCWFIFTLLHIIRKFNDAHNKFCYFVNFLFFIDFLFIPLKFIIKNSSRQTCALHCFALLVTINWHKIKRLIYLKIKWLWRKNIRDWTLITHDHTDIHEIIFTSIHFRTWN